MKMAFATRQTGLFLSVLFASFWQVQCLIYHDFLAFKDKEMLNYGIFDIGSNLSLLNATDSVNENIVPKVNLFLVNIRDTPNEKDAIADICRSHHHYLKEKQIFLFVKSTAFGFLVECLKNSSNPSNEDLTRLSVAIEDHEDVPANLIKELQSLGVKFGINMARREQHVQKILNRYRERSVTIEIVFFPSFAAQAKDVLYEFNSFHKFFNEEYSRFKKAISGHDPQLVLLLFCSSCTEQYRSLVFNFVYRWAETEKHSVVTRHDSSHVKLKLDNFTAAHEKIFKRYKSQPFSVSVNAFDNASRPMLETELMCEYFDSVFIEVASNDINSDELMRLAFVHSKLPCKIKWNVRWEMKRYVDDSRADPLSKTSNYEKLSSLGKTYPGLISNVFIVLPRTIRDTDSKNIHQFLDSFFISPNITLSLVAHDDAGRVGYGRGIRWSIYNDSIGASIDMVESSLDERVLNYVTDNYKSIRGKILINYNFQNEVEEKEYGGCYEFKKKWTVLKNWADVHSFHVVVKSPLFSSSSEFLSWERRKPLLKTSRVFGDGFILGNATQDEFRFLSNVEDTCVTLPQKAPSSPVVFSSTHSGATFNLTSISYSQLGPEELAQLIQLIHFKFNAIEIIPKNHHSVDLLKAAIRIVEKHTDHSNFAQYKYYINILGGDSLSTLVGTYDEFAGVQFNHCSCNEDLIILQILRKASVRNVGFSISYDAVVNPGNHDHWKDLVPLTDYIVIRVNLAKAILMGIDAKTTRESKSLNEAFHSYIQYNPYDILPNPVFDSLRAARFNLQRLQPKVVVYMQVSWPTIDATKSLERTQKFWDYLKDFSNVFNFPFFINEAFDSSIDNKSGSSTLQYGWWKLINDSDVGNPINYVDKQADYYGLETQRPKSFPKPTNQNSIPVTELVLGMVAIVLVIILVAVVTIYRLRRTLLLTKEELREFEMGKLGFDSEIQHDNNYCSIAYNKEKYEISKNAFDVESSTLIGSGCFGLVYKTTIPTYDKPVAVKVPKISGKVELLSVLREIKLMSFVGEHENVLKLVGAYTKEIQKGVVYIITEFLSNGSLLAYLRNIKKTEYLNEDLMSELNQFCLDISQGMHFVSEKKVIHGDLSTRNVLLDSCKVCKICDFGLSRKLYDNMDLYVKTSSEPVPWKWMSVETLERSELSIKSDIWSMGVTFWEIFSFGEEPYQSLSWDVEFSKKLISGLRLPKPEIVDQPIYEIMLSCWKIDPEERPCADYFITFFRSLKNAAYITL